MVESPSGAESLTWRVKVLLETVGLVPNEAVTPFGNPPATRETFWSKPSDGITEIVVVPLLFCATVSGLGDAMRLKLPTARTVSVTVVLAVNAPSLPVIFTVDWPSVAVVLAVKVSTAVLRPGFGLNVAVTPAGTPDAERVTKLFSGLMMIMVPSEVPWTMLTVSGEAESVRPGLIVSLKVQL
jgi:hypothetical protein